MSDDAWITLNTADGSMRAYVARPTAPTDQAVVVLQEAFGVNENIRNVARRFALAGYLAVAPDLFHRTGTGELPYSEHATAVGLIGQIGAAAIEIDVSAVLEHLKTAEGVTPPRTAVVGFCFGGRAAFTAATRLPGLGATAVFYGPGIAAGPHAVLDQAGAITGPLLLHVGAEDPTIPAAQVEAIAAKLEQEGQRFEQYLYPDAGHAFACDARPQMYRAAAADLAWSRTFEFIGRHLSRNSS